MEINIRNFRNSNPSEFEILSSELPIGSSAIRTSNWSFWWIILSEFQILTEIAVRTSNWTFWWQNFKSWNRFYYRYYHLHEKTYMIFRIFLVLLPNVVGFWCSEDIITFCNQVKQPSVKFNTKFSNNHHSNLSEFQILIWDFQISYLRAITYWNML